MFDPSTIAAIVLKTSLLVVAIGIVASLVARQSAAWRHLLWAAALALSLLMPIAVVYLPSGVQVAMPWRVVEPWPLEEPSVAMVDARRADAVSAVPGAPRSERSTAPLEARATWPTLAIVWLVGALGMLLQGALAHVGLSRWVRNSTPELSPAWAATLRRAERGAEVPRRVRVLESGATSPCTFGVVRPVILLPAAGADWPEAQRRFTLLHELAHVRRLDYLTTQVANLACALHWFNPLVWLAAVQSRKLQEQACDDAVLNAGTTPSDYAQFLVGLAGGSRRLAPAYPAAVGMVQRSQLHGRVTAILDASRARLPLGGFALVAALAPLAGLTLFLATLSVAATPPAGSGIPLTEPFRSVQLRNGGHVRLVQGDTQAVTLRQGNLEQASIEIRDGRLEIDRCPAKCPANRDFEVEVVTPEIDTIAVAEGGSIQAGDGFAPQPGITVAVSQGGTIDIRALQAASVTASVFSGGRIFTTPRNSLTAAVQQGGNVTYWGDPALTVVDDGGVVERGRAADRDRSLAVLMGPQFVERPAPVPPVPPVPAIQSSPSLD
jgi:beta-lactamase regulating signal transducer with metallopeptidase domain